MSELSSLKADVASLADRVDHLSDRVDRLEARMGGLEDAVLTLNRVWAAAFAHLDEKVDKIDTMLVEVLRRLPE